MLGNVAEWCEDDWYGTYEGAPSDGTARKVTGSASGVRPGGSWGDGALHVRSAVRNAYVPSDCGNAVSFRCARVQNSD